MNYWTPNNMRDDRPLSRTGRICRKAAGVVLVLVLLALAAAPLRGVESAHAQGEGLYLNNLVLDNMAGEVTARFGVDVVGLRKVRRALEDEGAVLGLVCTASIERKRTMWMNAVLANTEYVSRLFKDALSDEYVLHLPGAPEPMRSKELEPMLKKAWDGVTLSLGPWSMLTPGSEYVLNLTIELKRADVPVWLDYTLFFWSWDVFPETSYQLDFIY
jgi:hypothetical protein